jgi:hypothetical protein
VARAHYRDEVHDQYGNMLPAATVWVYEEGTNTPLTKTLYADDSSAAALANPLTTDAQGRFEFYLDQPQDVDLLISGVNHQTTRVNRAAVGTGGLVGSPSITTQAMGDAPAAGTSTIPAPSGHRHGMPAFDLPVSLAAGQVGAAGVLGTVPRADHAHGLPAFATVLYRPTSLSSWANNAAEIPIFSYDVPANTFTGAGQGLRGRILGRLFNNGGVDRSCTLRIKFGIGVPMFAFTLGAPATGPDVPFVLEYAGIFTSPTIINLFAHLTAGASGQAGGGATVNATLPDTAGYTGINQNYFISTTSIQTLSVTAQLSAASPQLQFLANALPVERF